MSINLHSKRRIALVHPKGSNWLENSKDIITTINKMIPHGLLSIASWLLKEGMEVYIFDCLGPYASDNFEKNIHEILKIQPDIVGFSTTTSSFLDASRMASFIKNINPEIITVCGGVHCSSIGEKLMKDYLMFDYMVKGEGEITMAEIAKGISPENIAGLIWRNGNEIIENKPREMIKDLDILPFPAYEKLKGFPKLYNLPLFSYSKFPCASMITSRGCLYQCSYCDRSVYKKGFRYNSAEYVYEHFKYLNKNFGVKHINIYDDLFTTDEIRIEKFCKMLIEKPLKMNFNCAVRVGYAPDSLLKMLKSAGCLMVSLGIETSDPELLKKHKAGVTIDSIKDTIKRIQKVGLRAKGLFMMGLPGETEDSIKRTSDFIMSLNLDDMNMSKFTPFPGAPIWKNIKNEGSFEEDWEKMNCLNFVFVPKTIESKEKLEQLYKEHVVRFYTSKQWMSKFIKRIWQHRHSIWNIIKNLPVFIYAKKQFDPKISNLRGKKI
ncbi:MAG: radical SAM protein [Brevinematales bacterium]